MWEAPEQTELLGAQLFAMVQWHTGKQGHKRQKKHNKKKTRAIGSSIRTKISGLTA